MASNGLIAARRGDPMSATLHNGWPCGCALLMGLVVLVGGEQQPAFAFAPGEKCVLTRPLTMSSKPGGRGKKISLDAGERVSIEKISREWLRLSTPRGNGHVKQDQLERVCEVNPNPWRASPPAAAPDKGEADLQELGGDDPSADDDMAERAIAARTAAEREMDAGYADDLRSPAPPSKDEELNWEVDTGASGGDDAMEPAAADSDDEPVDDETASEIEPVDGEPVRQAEEVASRPDSSVESELFFVGVLVGVGVGSEFESSWFVFDGLLDLGWRMGRYVSFGLRLFMQGTPGIGYGFGGGMGTVRLIMPSPDFEPYLEGGVGYAMGGAGHLTSTIVGRVSVGGRYFMDDSFYMSLEAAGVFSEFSVSGVGLVGVGWSL